MVKKVKLTPPTSMMAISETDATKTLDVTSVETLKKKVPDVEVVGDGDTFLVVCKASSESEGWMKSTKVMPVRLGVVIQVSTQQRNPDGSYSLAEALTFVPESSVGALEIDGGRRVI